MAKPRSKTVLLSSAKKVCLCAAALLRKKWDELLPSGSNLLLPQLEQLAKRDDVTHLICFVPRVLKPKRANELLKPLAERGIEITWLGEFEKAGREALDGIDGAKLHVHPQGMLEAFKTWQPKLAKHPLLAAIETHSESNLDTFCDYYGLRHMMRNVGGTELLEAIETLTRLIPRLEKDKTLKLKHFPAELHPSLERQRSGDQAFLEGYSPTMQNLKKRIADVGPSELTVLIQGETGTCKEAVARWIHEFSPRRAHPFLAINCAGLEESFLRAELFGHTKGAFAGADKAQPGLLARAKGGTLFLDEVADLQPPLQAELLRFLQTRNYRPVGSAKEQEVDLRIIAACQTSPPDSPASGALRKDLYYRLAEVIIETPALRNIAQDIPYMVRHLAFRLARTPELRQRRDMVCSSFRWSQPVLETYTWPGNARELAALVRRALELGDDVIAELRGKVGVSPTSLPQADGPLSLSLPQRPEEICPLDEIKSAYVKAAHTARGKLTQQQLATKLGLSVNTLKRWIEA